MSHTAQLKHILAQTDSDLFLGGLGYPAQGQFVITGPQMGGTDESRVGFCVQVRKGVGAFGSHVVFLRHASGNLTTHENQGFFGMTPQQEADTRTLFDSLPEDEDYTQGYSICGEQHAIGFLVENAAVPLQHVSGSSMHLTIEETNADGEKSTTLVAFI